MSFRILLIYLLCSLWVIPKSNAQDNKLKEILEFEIMPIERLIRPSYLQEGDLVALVAPAGVIHDENAVFQFQEILNSWGLRSYVGDHVLDKQYHFSATDSDRLYDLQKAMDSTEVRAIWAIRGGYGSARIVDSLDFDKLLESPKWFIGYSDMTAIHSALNQQGMESIHGMMPVNLKDDSPEAAQSLEAIKEVLFGKRPRYEITPNPKNKIGEAKAKLVGGNLTLIQTNIGTSSAIDVSDKILFIEEVGEYHYHIDRMLRQLERNGYFESCQGLIVGDISNVRENTTPFGMDTEELILDILKDYDFPILFDFPAGHESLNLPLIFGREIQLKVKEDGARVKFKL